MDTINSDETFWDKWGISLAASFGVAGFTRYFTYRADIQQGTEDPTFFNNEFIITLFCSSAILFPLIYLTRKLLQTKSSIGVIKRDLDTINSKLNTEIDQNLNSIDEHSFKPDRIHFYKSEFSKIQNLTPGSNTYILKDAINKVLKVWNQKATNENTDLYQLIYHYLIKNLKDFNHSDSFIIPLKTYLDFLLSIIKIGFNINKKFFYYSFTNAQPYEWFEPVVEDSPLVTYRKDFADLIEKHNNPNNDLRRYVLTYDGPEKDFIKSDSEFWSNWNNSGLMGDVQKQNYIEKFITHKNAYVLKLHKDFEIVQGFTELIYIGGSNEDGSPNWKWVLKGEYIQDSKSMLFQMHNLRADDTKSQLLGELPLAAGHSVKDATSSGQRKNKTIKLGEFPDVINSEIDVVQSDSSSSRLFEVIKLKIDDTNNNEAKA